MTGPRGTSTTNRRMPHVKWRMLHVSATYPGTVPHRLTSSKVDFIFLIGEFYFSTHNPSSFKLGPGMWPEVDKMWTQNYTSPLTIKKMSTTLKWESKVDFVFGNKEYYFSTHNPTSFKLEPGMWPKVEKMCAENYISPLAIKTMTTTLKWVSKVDFIFGNRGFYFSTRNPSSFKLGPDMWPEVEKMRPENYTSLLPIKTTSRTLEWVSKFDFIFGNKEFYISTHNPTFFKRAPGMWPKVEKMRPHNYTSSLAIKNTSTTLKWVSKVDFIFGKGEFYFSAHNPISFKLGPGMWPEVEKMCPENYTSPIAIKTTSTILKWVSKLDFIFGNREFYFSTQSRPRL